ncbi:MAG: FkbM family methyltransferase [Rhizobiaceae bacterium]|nr:FkbM family methyltransferase [Rhizobiaceae bacterium]
MLNTIKHMIQRRLRKPRYRGLKKDIHQFFDLIAFKQTGHSTHSQTGQEIMALIVSGFKRNGYFVDFGATDGILNSNSYLLEKKFGWQGILAEPERSWHDDLKSNRSAHIETDCVWKQSGETIEFDMIDNGELSTISSYAGTDHLSSSRKNKTSYQLQTISLLDLLKKYDAPETIDYLSIDTEGSEFEILNAFDFTQNRFNLITVEHNYTDNRENIRRLLEVNGYRRVLKNLSRQDDWYIHETVDLPDTIS